MAAALWQAVHGGIGRSGRGRMYGGTNGSSEVQELENE